MITLSCLQACNLNHCVIVSIDQILTVGGGNSLFWLHVVKLPSVEVVGFTFC